MPKKGEYLGEEKKEVFSLREQPSIKKQIKKEAGGLQAFWDECVEQWKKRKKRKQKKKRQEKISQLTKRSKSKKKTGCM